MGAGKLSMFVESNCSKESRWRMSDLTVEELVHRKGVKAVRSAGKSASKIERKCHKSNGDNQ